MGGRTIGSTSDSGRDSDSKQTKGLWLKGKDLTVAEFGGIEWNRVRMRQERVKFLAKERRKETMPLGTAVLLSTVLYILYKTGVLTNRKFWRYAGKTAAVCAVIALGVFIVMLSLLR